MSEPQSNTPSAPPRISHCRSCGAPIVWLVTDSGKSIPVNAETVQSEDELFEWGRHTSHFASCPDALQWRKTR